MNAYLNVGSTKSDIHRAHECVTDGSPCPCEPEVFIVEGKRRGR